jgi:putative methionine-R-sulfoxide reductase with GAF domain/ligand-binding sensor domain-containing protein
LPHLLQGDQAWSKKSYISSLKKIALLYCSLALLATQLYGQLPDYHVQKLPGKNGLIQPNQVEEMIKDNKGFLWLRSFAKVQRFDGKNILSFSFDDRFIGIQQDDEGTVWLASRQNIYRFKNEFEGFEKLNEYSSTVNKYLSLLAGPQKKLYLLATEGILRWNKDANKMEPMGIPPFKGGGSFAFLQFYGDCLFYRLSNTTVVRYNTVTAALDSVHVQQANYLIPVDEDKGWMRQGIGGTVLVSFKTKKVAPVNKGQFDETFTDNNFFITAASAGWSGKFFTSFNDKGYYTYNSTTNRFKKTNFFTGGRLLSGKPLLTRNNFFKEDNGTTWFTNEEGIFYWNPYIGSIGLLRSAGIGAGSHTAAIGWDNNIRNLTEDNKGNIWFGTANGFCKWDKTGGTVSTWTPDFTSTNYLNYPSVKSIGFAKGKIIIGQSEKGFWIFDPVKQTFSRPQFAADSLKKQFGKEFNTNMLQLRNGNFLVLSGRVWLIDKGTFYVNPLKVPEAALFSRKAYEDAQERIWLLGARGIAVMDKNFTVLYSSGDKERGRWYNAILQMNSTTFWVAAKSLYEIKLQPEKQLAITPILPELKALHFSNLFKDSLGHIWMCSDEGMYRYIPEKNIAEKFDLSDNMQSFYAALSNSFRGSDGTVYFGSINGINYFVPEKIQLQNDSLQVHLLKVTVNHDDSSFRLIGFLKGLRHYQNAVVFDFVSPYLYNPEKILYRYKLSGADDAWINNGNNTSVRFNSLKPGSYSFQVAASLNGKDWFEMNQPFAFVINPPFWKTLWFIALLMITVASLFVFLFKRRIAFIKKREAEKTVLQQLKAAGYREQLEIEQIINHFATSMNSISNIDDLLWDVGKNCISKLNFEDCVIYLKDENRNVLIQKAAWGPKTTEENKIINPIEIPVGKGIVGSVAQSGKAEIINDTSLDGRYIVDDARRFSEIAIPITNKGVVIGVIDSEHHQKNFYTQRHLQILQTIAALCAGKIETIDAEKQTGQKEMEVLRLNKDFATSQLTALRMQMNPHFIFNALNSVQHYILQGNVVEANRYLSKFSKLQREILHCSSQQFISLEKELEILAVYLELEQYRFGKSFTYKINVHDAIEPVEINIPPMILQPFVENAIWHGLMPLQTERVLSIYFDLETDDVLLATLRDNGIGRIASAKLKESNGENKTGHQSKGMSMVEQRLQLLQQQYDKPFEVSIADITGIKGEVQGTEVTLKIFIGNKKHNYDESINNR